MEVKCKNIKCKGEPPFTYSPREPAPKRYRTACPYGHSNEFSKGDIDEAKLGQIANPPSLGQNQPAAGLGQLTIPQTSALKVKEQAQAIALAFREILPPIVQLVVQIITPDGSDRDDLEGKTPLVYSIADQYNQIGELKKQVNQIPAMVEAAVEKAIQRVMPDLAKTIAESFVKAFQQAPQEAPKPRPAPAEYYL